MSNYTINVDWDGKDALADSSAAKVISGDDFQTEFETVQTAVNSKADIASPTLTGTPAAPTATTGTNTTQVATTAFVQTELGTITAAVVNALVYPVGSLYFNMANADDPNTLLGVGVWVRYATGEVLVGIEDSGTFDALNESLGAETVSAGTTGSTAADLAAHTHTIQKVDSTTGDSTAGVGSYTTNKVDAGTFTTGETGSGGGHTHTTPAVSTLQPSVTVYIWRRES